MTDIIDIIYTFILTSLFLVGLGGILNIPGFKIIGSIFLCLFSIYELFKYWRTGR